MNSLKYRVVTEKLDFEKIAVLQKLGFKEYDSEYGVDETILEDARLVLKVYSLCGAKFELHLNFDSVFSSDSVRVEGADLGCEESLSVGEFLQRSRDLYKKLNNDLGVLEEVGIIASYNDEDLIIKYDDEGFGYGKITKAINECLYNSYKDKKSSCYIVKDNTNKKRHF